MNTTRSLVSTLDISTTPVHNASMPDAEYLHHHAVIAAGAYADDWPHHPADPVRWQRVYDDQTGASAHILLYPHLVYLVFRGVEPLDDLQDWRTVLDGRATSWTYLAEGRSVHRGILHAYQSVGHQLVGLLVDHMAHHPQAKVRTVGHSMGGAMAQLAQLEIQSLVPDVRCITYGAPAIFRPQAAAVYARKCGDHTTRVVLGSDLVPRLSSPTGYRHGTPMTYLTRGGRLPNPLYARWHRLTRVLANLNLRDYRGLQDHRYQQYVRSLAKAVERT